MRRKGLLAMGLTLCLYGAAAANTATTLTPAQIEQAKTWVRQLGDRSFKTRELATKNLAELGKAAIPVLQEAVKEEDAEVRRRSGHLLELAQRTDTEVALALFMERKDDSKILKLPSWDRFSKMMGKDDATKRMFVDIYCAEGTLLTELDRNPGEFNARFTAHIQKIQQTLYTPLGQANPIPHFQVVALLFMATEPSVSKDLNSFYMINNLFWQPTVQQGFRDNAGSRKLLMAFLEQRNNAQTAQQIFHIAKQMGLKEAVPLAVKVVNDRAVPGYTRGMALLFIGQMNGTEHKKEIEKLLDDKSTLGSVRTGTMTINAQMRDVALASLIMLSGQSIYDYNFPYLANFRNVARADLNLPPYYYGFADDTQRDTAFKKFRATQPPEKKPSPNDTSKK